MQKMNIVHVGIIFKSVIKVHIGKALLRYVRFPSLKIVVTSKVSIIYCSGLNLLLTCITV